MRKLELPIMKISKEYESGINTTILAKKYNCAVSTINSHLRKFGVKLRSTHKLNTLNLPIEIISKEYIFGVSTFVLGEKYNCDAETITAHLRKNGIEIRTAIEKNELNLPIEIICEEYKSGMNSVDISKKYNCTDTTIRKHLRKNNVKIRSYSEVHRGKKNGRWLGGVSNGGYCNLFNKSLKEAVRLYFNNNCFMDNEPEENGNALSIHHVNFDKRCGCDATQFCIFVPVKNSWNSRFNGSKEYNRWYWYTFLMVKIFTEYPNYFSYHIPVWGMCKLEYNYSYVFEKFRRR